MNMPEVQPDSNAMFSKEIHGQPEAIPLRCGGQKWTAIDKKAKEGQSGLVDAPSVLARTSQSPGSASCRRERAW